jgi:hypothetical protein
MQWYTVADTDELLRLISTIMFLQANQKKPALIVPQTLLAKGLA